MENINPASSQVSPEKKEQPKNEATQAANSVLDRLKRALNNARLKTDVYMVGTLVPAVLTVISLAANAKSPYDYVLSGINALGIGVKGFALFSTERVKKVKKILRENKEQNLPLGKSIKRTAEEFYKLEQ